MIRLLRYNFRVVMFGNWWLLVFPIAVSQLVVFWNLITLRFTENLPAHAVETTPPLLAAFLSAHLLTAEYRSGIGAILASKPVDIAKVVLIRLLVVTALVWALAGLSLVAFYYGWEPYPMAPAALACIPSTLFMALLALTFATLFRNAWAGFAVAAAWWAMDLAPGVAIQPFLSLQTVSDSMVGEAVHRATVFTRYAWQPKLILLCLAAMLYFYHRRLIFTLGTQPSARQRRRALAAAVAIPVLYALSGAVLKVGYLYVHRGDLHPDDTAWIRQQLGPFGPVPVRWLFGPAFAAYVGEIPNTWRLAAGEDADVYGDTARHLHELTRLLRQRTRSIWGSNIAELYTRLAGQHVQTPQERIRLYREAVEAYPDGPHAPGLLVRIARELVETGDTVGAMDACQDALKARPNRRVAAEALRTLTALYRQAGNLVAAGDCAQKWAAVADSRQKFKALEARFDIMRDIGRTEEAREAAQAVLKAIDEFRREANAPDAVRTAGTDTPLIKDADAAANRMRSFLAGKPGVPAPH
jgi:ABC-type transport system involved in multi-copper enzyme maturation permease subunit